MYKTLFISLDEIPTDRIKPINSYLERKVCAKQQIPSRFMLLRFASSFLVAAGYRFNRG